MVNHQLPNTQRLPRIEIQICTVHIMAFSTEFVIKSFCGWICFDTGDINGRTNFLLFRENQYEIRQFLTLLLSS